MYILLDWVVSGESVLTLTKGTNMQETRWHPTQYCELFIDANVGVKFQCTNMKKITGCIHRWNVGVKVPSECHMWNLTWNFCGGFFIAITTKISDQMNVELSNIINEE